jgi:type IV pilus assembly protein PilE
MDDAKGFSLIELIIVMLVIAILAAIAIPSYRQHILRSHRIDATRALQDLASRQERYYFSHNRYSKTLADLGSDVDAAGAYYALDMASASSTDYTATAIATGIQIQDAACATLSLNRAGVKQSTGADNNNAACWGG